MNIIIPILLITFSIDIITVPTIFTIPKGYLGYNCHLKENRICPRLGYVLAAQDIGPLIS